MVTIDRPSAMQEWAGRARRSAQRIGLVPTMGYLHPGHLSLLAGARRHTDCCVVSIFVNPLQFGPQEDFSRYPRDQQRDTTVLSEAGVDVLYVPSAAAMYPDGFQSAVRVAEVTRRLCGRSRPGHFEGVTTVVAKLFNAVKPHVAVFGEKDFQQLVAIRRMVKDLDFDIEIISGPIVREPDGVATSSRNANLTPAERIAARCLSRALALATEAVKQGERHADAILDRVRMVLDAEPLVRGDYAELVDVDALEPVSEVDRPTLLALAVYIGQVRLIDNTILK